MTLPVKALPSETLDIEGQKVLVRGLSRTEAMHFTTGFTEEAMPGVLVEERANAAEVYLLVKGVGVTEAEAEEWRNTTDLETVGFIVEKVVELSALIDRKDADPK
jgi:hypothetical protein